MNMQSETEMETETLYEPALTEIPLKLGNLARMPALALIRLYQKTISRAIPVDTCRFTPSCSQYGYQAIAKYGLIKGGWMAFRRVMRCNPFHSGGYDPVP